jgi:hypothetical protein
MGEDMALRPAKIAPQSRICELSLTILAGLMPMLFTHAETPTNVWRADQSFLFLWPGQSPDDARLDLSSPILTDRPNFTEASRTVGRDVSQVELGYTYSYSGARATHQSLHQYPEGLLRRGILADWFEVRLGQSFTTNDTPDNSATDIGDTYVGIKLGITPQYGVLPELSIVPSTLLPTGTGESSSNQALPGVNLVYLWSLSRTAYLSGTSKVYRGEEDLSNDFLTTWAQSAVLSSRIVDSVSGYIEWYGLFQDSSESGGTLHFTDAGLTYLYSENIQYDIRFGTRLQGRFGEEVFAGVGVSRRFF